MQGPLSVSLLLSSGLQSEIVETQRSAKHFLSEYVDNFCCEMSWNFSPAQNLAKKKEKKKKKNGVSPQTEKARETMYRLKGWEGEKEKRKRK